MKSLKLTVLLLLVTAFTNLNASVAKNDFSFISIAKSGTHLSSHCIYLLTNKDRMYIPKLGDLRFINNKYFIGTHFCHPQVVEHILSSLDTQKLIIHVRDPRSILVAAAFYYKEYKYMDPSKPEGINPLFPFHDMAIKKRITIYLRRALQGQYIPTPIYDIKKAVSTIKELGQSNKDYLVMRYEDLVGSNGGGNDQMQRESIRKLAIFLKGEPSLSSDQIDQIGKSIYGTGPTFRQGHIHSWEQYFDEDMKAMCKQLLGQEIIDLGYEQNNDW